MAILIACEFCRKTQTDPAYRWIQVQLPVDGVNLDSMRSMMGMASQKNWHYEELLFCSSECIETFFVMRRMSEKLETTP